MKPSRRQLLALLACVPVAGVIGAGGLGLRWWDRPPGATLLALSDDEYALVQAFAEAWMPPGGDPPLSGADADTGAFFDTLLAHAPARERQLLKLLLQALDDATWPTHFSAFRDLPIETRTAVLIGWLASDVAELRTAVHGLLLLASEGFATHPDVVKHLAGEFGCGYGR